MTSTRTPRRTSAASARGLGGVLAVLLAVVALGLSGTLSLSTALLAVGAVLAGAFSLVSSTGAGL